MYMYTYSHKYHANSQYVYKRVHTYRYIHVSVCVCVCDKQFIIVSSKHTRYSGLQHTLQRTLQRTLQHLHPHTPAEPTTHDYTLQHTTKLCNTRHGPLSTLRYTLNPTATNRTSTNPTSHSHPHPHLNTSAGPIIRVYILHRSATH